MSKARVTELVWPLIALRALRLPGKSLWQEALELYRTAGMDFADAFNVAYMRSVGVSRIYSWDTDFDDVPGITRLEPGEEAMKEAA